MRIRLLVATAGCLVLAAMAGNAFGHRAAHETLLVMFDSGDPDTPGFVYVVGQVESDTTKCVGNRKVKIYFKYGSPSADETLVDTDLSSGHGMFSGSGPIDDGMGGDIQGVVFKTAKVTRGSKHHPVVCAGARAEPS